MQEVDCVVVEEVWWNVIDVIVNLLVLTRLCCTIGIVCGRLPVVGQNFLENGRMVWCCCGCVLAPPFWPSFRSIEHIKCTLLALAATPLQWT